MPGITYITNNAAFQNKEFMHAMYGANSEASAGFKKPGYISKRAAKELCEDYGVNYSDYKKLANAAKSAYYESFSPKYEDTRKKHGPSTDD